MNDTFVKPELRANNIESDRYAVKIVFHGYDDLTKKANCSRQLFSSARTRNMCYTFCYRNNFKSFFVVICTTDI